MNISINHVAKICYEAHRTYCEAMGDHSHPQWEEAPPEQVESIISIVTFLLDNPDATPSESHDSWASAKRMEGWSEGVRYDLKAKTDPSLADYRSLPLEIRVKANLFHAIVKAIHPMIEGRKDRRRTIRVR